MARLVGKLARNERLRDAAITSYRAYARAVIFYPPPRVLANGIPKSGTHLLTSLLARLPRMMFSGIHHALNDFSISSGIAAEEMPEIDHARLTHELRRVNHGQFMSSHFPAHPRLPQLLASSGYKTIVMLRDPRDIVVSHTFYVTRLSRHFLYRRYNELYKSDKERLLASITGFAADDYSAGQESIGRRLDKYLPWLKQGDVHVTRFESLVGEAGGGRREEQYREIATIAAHVGRAVSDEQVVRIAGKVWSPRVATFRKGRVGDWIEQFDDEHKAAFKEVAGRQLIDLGYETHLDW